MKIILYLLAGIVGVIYFRRWLTVVVILIVELFFILFAFGEEPTTTWGGWQTCKGNYAIDVYGEQCKPFSREVQMVISDLPSAGEGSSQRTEYVYVPGPIAPSVSSTTNNYQTTIITPWSGQHPLGHAIVRGSR